MRRSIVLSLPLVLVAALAACAPSGADLQVSSPDDHLRLSSRLVFSTVDEAATPARPVTLRNGGGADLTVSDVAISGTSFTLADGQATSFTLAPGAAADVSVLYRPPTTQTTITTDSGTLTISSDDEDTPTAAVTLKGLNTPFFEDRGEPTLRRIASTFGYRGSGMPDGVQPPRTPVFEEVVSPYWRRADATASVELHPLARYAARTLGATGGAGWFPKGSPGDRRQLYEFAGGPVETGGGENQKLLPRPTTSVTSFDPTAGNPGGTFGLFADRGRSFSDDGLHRYTDETGTVVQSQVHNFRFFRAQRGDGTVIPDTWVAAVDIGQDPRPGFQKNYDYQDYVFLLANATPELTPAARAGSTHTLGFGTAVDATVVDSDGEGTGFTGVQANDAGNQHDPSLVDLDTSASALRLTTTAGTNSGGADTQRNALQRTFDASCCRWGVGTKLLDPAGPMTTPLQHQAVFFGPDNGNFVKLEVEHRDGAAQLVSYFEQNGAFVAADLTPIVIPAGATVELYLLGDANLRTVQPAYKLNGGPLTNFGAAYAPNDSARWFSVQASAGIFASNQSSAVSFTATFDSFFINAR